MRRWARGRVVLVSIAGLALLMLASWPRRSARAPTIVLVVLDTVRADHTSLCGYERPTTPFLAALVAAGAAHSCRAYPPAGWTLPSHTSYLSGVPPTQHGADFDDTAPRRDLAGWSASAHLVPDALPLLAEGLDGDGYQTVLVSANPILVPAGLGRGFRTISTAARPFPGAEAVSRVGRILDELDRGRPLFLVVNLMDAHAPWAPVPAGVGWVAARPLQAQEDALRILDRSTDASERAALLQWRTDLYDYGVSRADEGARLVFEALRRRGWLVAGSRLVVTADHGEFLGEHERIDHGEELYEPQQRVPLVVWGPDRLALPEPVPGIVVYDLLRRGALPSALPPIVATQRRRHDSWGDALGGDLRPSAARWSGTRKELLVGDVAYRFDLAHDVDESHGERLPDGDPATLALRAALSATRGAGRRTSPALRDALRALGYAD